MAECLKCERWPGGYELNVISEPWCQECRKKHHEEYAPVYKDWFAKHTTALLRGMGVPPIYRSCTLDGFETGLPDQSRVLKAVRSWFEGEPPGLFLCGPVGTGKTHLAVAVLLELRFRRCSGKFVSAQELILKCYDSFSDSFGDDTRLSSILEEYSGADTLVLDDLGAEKATDFVRDKLGVLVNRAYCEGQFLIVTSNLDLTALAKKLDARIADRLVQMCQSIKFVGGSYRQKIAADRAAERNFPRIQVVQ
jgi:DNA replication protein DnaC